MDKVFIEGLVIEALIGNYDWERRAPQRLRFDLWMDCDCRTAGLSDKVADTVDYAKVVDRMSEICASSRYRLLEALAEEIAARLLDEFPVVALTLRASKPDAILAAKDVGIKISRARKP